MSEWKNKISNHFGGHIARKVEVTNAIANLLSELKNEPDIRHVDLQTHREYPLAWVVSVNGYAVVIEEDEISQSQKLYSEYGAKLEEKRDLSETLKEILTKYFT